jgi:hypothetical protein
MLARTKAGGDRISATPVVSNDIVIVQSDTGKVLAYKATPKSLPKAAAKVNVPAAVVAEPTS